MDVNVFKGAGEGISDYYLVKEKIRCLRKWPGRVIKAEERYDIKVSELSMKKS